MNDFNDTATLLDAVSEQRDIQQASITDGISAIWDAVIATDGVDLPDNVFASLLNTADADIELDAHLASAQQRLVDQLIGNVQDEIDDDIDEDFYS